MLFRAPTLTALTLGASLLTTIPGAFAQARSVEEENDVDHYPVVAGASFRVLDDATLFFASGAASFVSIATHMRVQRNLDRELVAAGRCVAPVRRGEFVFCERVPTRQVPGPPSRTSSTLPAVADGRREGPGESTRERVPEDFWDALLVHDELDARRSRLRTHCADVYVEVPGRRVSRLSAFTSSANPARCPSLDALEIHRRRASDRLQPDARFSRFDSALGPALRQWNVVLNAQRGRRVVFSEYASALTSGPAFVVESIDPHQVRVLSLLEPSVRSDECEPRSREPNRDEHGWWQLVERACLPRGVLRMTDAAWAQLERQGGRE